MKGTLVRKLKVLNNIEYQWKNYIILCYKVNKFDTVLFT